VIPENDILERQIFNITSSEEFISMALRIFHKQYSSVQVYREYCDMLKVDSSNVIDLNTIPFLPIQFFKTHHIQPDDRSFDIVFSSSGTTGNKSSKHFVKDIKFYQNSFLRSYEKFIGDPKEYTILALLPSYLEREDSSLVYMVDILIKKSQSSHSGFYLNNIDELIDKLQYLEEQGKRTLLIGVSYALLDLIEKKTFLLKNTKVLETGGMKGKRKEMIKKELHQILKKGFGVSVIYSEYGMTELLSQAYSKGDGIFYCPPWMKVITRDTEDPLTKIEGTTGGLNIIDLANVNSCSFIATQDLGKVFKDGSFEILGRFDESDIRGCNLMYDQ
jgi:phenylacetate-coenzyme A ligase PaaK-like adenylate-forming protein